MDISLPFTGKKPKPKAYWLGSVLIDPPVEPCPKCDRKGEVNGGLCWQCWGHGWVKQGTPDATCLHEFGTAKNIGNCLHSYECSECGTTRTVDSSG